MSGQIVRVKRDKIRACMTCPLCNKLLKLPTTISLCLHTFCRKCIYEKFSDDDVDCCPVCDIKLGCVPVEKLRPDHSLQDIRAKIFPLKGSKVEAPEVAPPVCPPAKRKERSLSSLVVSAPKVSVQAGVTGRRTRSGVRKISATRNVSPAIEETPKKEDDFVKDRLDGSGSPETLNKIMQNKKQNSSAKSSNDQIHGELVENNNELKKGKVDLWKPLNTLLEAANKSKFSKSNLQGPSHVKVEDASCSGDIDMSEMQIEDNGQRAEVQNEKSSMPSVPGPVKRKRIHSTNRKRSTTQAETSSPQVMVNKTRQNWKDGPIWFSLVSLKDQVGGEPLPQVSAAFLRVKDGNMPVSSIQKYLAKKLDLASEAEVQIMCQGQPVMAHLKLSSLLDAWLGKSPSKKKVKTSVGNSAKEFVMILSYARSVAVATT